MSKFTKGPWNILEVESEYGSVIAESQYEIDADELAVAVIVGDGIPEAAANARLIAAAPELYAALIELEQLVTAHIGDEADNWCRSARAALALVDRDS